MCLHKIFCYQFNENETKVQITTNNVKEPYNLHSLTEGDSKISKRPVNWAGACIYLIV